MRITGGWSEPVVMSFAESLHGFRCAGGLSVAKLMKSFGGSPAQVHSESLQDFRYVAVFARFSPLRSPKYTNRYRL
jgi:hypothetical protein